MYPGHTAKKWKNWNANARFLTQSPGLRPWCCGKTWFVPSSGMCLAMGAKGWNRDQEAEWQTSSQSFIGKWNGMRRRKFSNPPPVFCCVILGMSTLLSSLGWSSTRSKVTRWWLTDHIQPTDTEFVYSFWLVANSVYSFWLVANIKWLGNFI